MTAVGCFRVVITWYAATQKVQILSTQLSRPAVTDRFQGQSPEAVEQWVALLYGVCREAQRFAARLALALGVEDDKAAERVWQEAMREHLLHCLQRWPETIGETADLTALREWQSEVAHQSEAVRSAWVETRLTPIVLPFVRYWAAAVPALGAAMRARWTRIQRDLGFPREAVRGWLNLRVERRNGENQVTVNTARGELTHRAEVCDGRVIRYAIEAPTDRLCAEGARLREWVETVPCATLAAAERLGRAAVVALDPCVPYRLEVHDA